MAPSFWVCLVDPATDQPTHTIVGRLIQVQQFSQFVCAPAVNYALHHITLRCAILEEGKNSVVDNCGTLLIDLLIDYVFLDAWRRIRRIKGFTITILYAKYRDRDNLIFDLLAFAMRNATHGFGKKLDNADIGRTFSAAVERAHNCLLKQIISFKLASRRIFPAYRSQAQQGVISESEDGAFDFVTSEIADASNSLVQ